MVRSIVFLPFLVGCGWSWDRYIEEKQQATCQMLVDCEYADIYGWSTVDDCLTAQQSSADAAADSECADYDGGAAKKCVEAYLALSCEDFPAGTSQIDDCNQVCPGGEDTGG